MDFSEIVFRKFDTPTGKVVVEEHMPSMFSSLRDSFGDAKTFVHAMTSLGGGKMGEGKSKMLFFKSEDSSFVAKTVKKTELEYFRKICESYYYHMISHPNTLLSRFYGLYRIAVRLILGTSTSCHTCIVSSERSKPKHKHTQIDRYPQRESDGVVQ